MVTALAEVEGVHSSAPSTLSGEEEAVEEVRNSRRWADHVVDESLQCAADLSESSSSPIIYHCG